MHERPTFGSLFAGIGGIDLGLERAGWRGRWQVEYEPFCQRVLAKHWPDVTRYGDIKDVDWSGVESVDLVAGGFPCQPFSVAGKQRGMDDDRWLWPEFERCIRELRPRYVLVENVPGLLVGRGMDAVLGGLADLGYDTEWESIPAAAVGAPHLRYRIWIIGTLAHATGNAGWIGDRDGETDVPDAHEFGRQGERSSGLLDGIRAAFGDDADGRGRALADTASLGPPRSREHGQPVHPAPGGDGQASEPRDGGWWSVEPDVRGMADGIPQGLDGAVDASQGMGSGSDAANGYQETLRSVLETVIASPPASRGRRSDEQLARQLDDALRQLPHGSPLGNREDRMAAALGYLHGLRKAGEAAGFVRDASHPLDEAWLALSGEETDWWDLAARRGPWAAEWPGVPRVSKGVPARVDRLGSLGNAVVPQVVEFIGRRILEAEAVTA